MDEKTTQDKMLEKVEKKLNELLDSQGVKKDNIDYLYKLVDIHKDLKNEEYWKVKEEKYNDEIQRRIRKTKRSFYG